MALTAAGCGAESAAEPPAPQPSTVASQGAGKFDVVKPDATAVTYKPELVPVGASVEAVVATAASGVVTELKVTGLTPGRAYGAHAHVYACGEKPDAAGPHFQHTPDPVTPSVDPEYANPRNEIWLDFTTDAQGAGSSRSTVDWQLPDRWPGSVVIHEKSTETAAHHAGTAGARLACVTLKR